MWTPTSSIVPHHPAQDMSIFSATLTLCRTVKQASQSSSQPGSRYGFVTALDTSVEKCVEGVMMFQYRQTRPNICHQHNKLRCHISSSDPLGSYNHNSAKMTFGLHMAIPITQSLETCASFCRLLQTLKLVLYTVRYGMLQGCGKWCMCQLSCSFLT